MNTQNFPTYRRTYMVHRHHQLYSMKGRQVENVNKLSSSCFPFISMFVLYTVMLMMNFYPIILTLYSSTVLQETCDVSSWHFFDIDGDQFWHERSKCESRSYGANRYFSGLFLDEVNNTVPCRFGMQLRNVFNWCTSLALFDVRKSTKLSHDCSEF